MIYHKYSLVGYMLWCRYALARLRPFTSLDYIYANYLESPGTKAYSVSEAKNLFNQFKEIEIHTVLTHGDLLSSAAGQRHQGWILSLAKACFPRKLICRLFPHNGLFMLISLKK